MRIKSISMDSCRFYIGDIRSPDAELNHDNCKFFLFDFFIPLVHPLLEVFLLFVQVVVIQISFFKFF